VTAVLPPRVSGILLDLILYLAAVTWVYYARNRTAEADERAGAGQDTDVTPIYRVQKLKRWSWWECLDPVVLSSDVFDRGSLANLQILFFTLLVAYGLVFVTVQTGELSSISPTVVSLLGISALGALGNKAVNIARDRISTGNWAWLVSRKVIPINDPGREGRPHWTDLVMTDAELDLYKLQALVFSIIVGVAMILGGFSLATFSVPPEMLEILGLSQLVFVGGRLAMPATLGDLNTLIDELRAREAELRQAAFSGIDVDAAGKPMETIPRKPVLDGQGQPVRNSTGEIQWLESRQRQAVNEHGTGVVDAESKPVPTTAAAPYHDLKLAQLNVPNAWRRYLDAKERVAVLLESLVHRSINTAYLEHPILL
jgi:hypothetical protein